MTRLLEPVDGSTVLYLPMWEGVGTFLEDLSRYKNHGTVFGATWTDGAMGKALSFDGGNDYVEVADANSLDLTEITAMLWIRPASITVTWQGLLHKYTGTSNNNTLYLELNLQNINNYNTIATTTNPINTVDKWYHVVYSAKQGGKERIYVNGILLAEENNQFVSTNNAYSLYIGAANPSAERFKGIIDEVRVFNRALSATEIFEEYYRGARGSY